MSCGKIIQMRDRNSGCTNQPNRCWQVPEGFTVEAGARFDPRALGWIEDVGCVTYAASVENCATCADSAPCVTPTKSAETTLVRRLDGTATLALHYGSPSDNFVYRLKREVDGAAVLTAQTSGGDKTLLVNYTFPPLLTYVLVVERVGQSSCSASEAGLVVIDPSSSASTWQSDGEDVLAA